MTEGVGGVAAPVVSLRGVTRRFGSLTALDGLDLDLSAGEVVALLGENGAGKSTVVNILSGALRPDSGTLALDGRPVTLRAPAEALAAGIGTVHQHFMLIPAFTVVENVILGDPRTPRGRLDLRAAAARVAAIAEDLGLRLDPFATVGSLDVAAQQRVEIVKALWREVRVLLLDEPTAVLARADAQRLFAVVERLKARGVAVLLITHKLDDVFRAADRVVILRKGLVVGRHRTADVDPPALIGMMVGAAIPEPDRADLRPAASASPVVRVEGVDLRRANGSLAASDVSFEARPGEILAIAGVEGNGQGELVRCLAGLEHPARGRIECLGLRSDRPRHWTPRALRRAGLAHVPEDRRRDGIVGSAPLTDNHLLSHSFRRPFARFGLIRRTPALAAVRAAIARFAVRTPGDRAPIAALSGGNQQKLVLAREFAASPKVLLAAQPTRGLDILTTAFVRDLLLQERQRGAAVILASADLTEIWDLADRILVLGGGRGHGPFDRRTTTREEIAAHMVSR
jgi:general nucleoside transport system ATP-binding protein